MAAVVVLLYILLVLGCSQYWNVDAQDVKNSRRDVTYDVHYCRIQSVYFLLLLLS